MGKGRVAGCTALGLKTQAPSLMSEFKSRILLAGVPTLPVSTLPSVSSGMKAVAFLSLVSQSALASDCAPSSSLSATSQSHHGNTPGC